MKATGYEGPHNLSTNTIDRPQGPEYDYVILDLVVDDRVGMLSETERVKVAVTRARLGLIIVGAMNQIAKATGNGHAIRGVKNWFKHTARVWTIKNLTG